VQSTGLFFGVDCRAGGTFVGNAVKNAAWLLAAGALICGTSFAAPPPREILVVTDINYPPYLFQGDGGVLQGIIKDKWELWSQRTGVKVRVQGMEWAQAQQSVLQGTADVVETLSYTEARAKLYEYSPAYAPIEARVFFHRSVTGINDVASMRGFTIGAKDGSACAAWLAARGVETISAYSDSALLVQAAGKREVRLFCMDTPAAHYYLFKHGLADDFRETPPLYTTQFHWAVKKGQPELRDFIQAGFGKISEKEINDINARWEGTPLRVQLSERHTAYLVVAAVVAIGFLALFLVWNRTLQSRVSARTAELREALESLQASETRLATIIRASPQSISITSADDGTYVEVNPAGERYTGFSREELIGNSTLKLGVWPDPDARQRFVDDVRRDGVVESRELRLRRKNGDLREVLASAALIELKGRKYVLTQSVDITQHKAAERRLEESERRLARLIEASPELIAVVDAADGRFIQVNPACEKVLGYPGAEMLGRTGAELGLWPDLDARARHFDEIGRAGAVHGREVRVRRKDGDVRDILSSAAVFEFDHRKFILFQAVDITEQKAAQQALSEHQSLLRELAAHHESVREGERAHIAREIHDELGQALTALKMDLSVLSMKFGDAEPRIKEPVQALKTSVDSIIQVVRNVATSLRPAALDLGFLSGVEWLVGEFRRRSAIGCTVSVPQGEIVLGEERSIVLFRILQESLTNIARHAQARNVEIFLQQEAGRVRLEVQDDGVGFDIESAQGRKTFGLLGMRERAIMLKGEMSIDSAPGRGTRVSVSMPVA
jgi:two-component system cell cycle sensor histidine kinase/response regulator CckA